MLWQVQMIEYFVETCTFKSLKLAALSNQNQNVYGIQKLYANKQINFINILVPWQSGNLMFFYPLLVKNPAIVIWYCFKFSKSETMNMFVVHD